MDTLTLPERQAIEQKYLGASHEQIAESVGIPKQTVDDWFRSRGHLSPYYMEWSTAMNGKREAHIAERLHLLDDEWLRLTTNVVLAFARRLADGSYKPKMLDFYRAWKMQRVMLGLPTNITETRCRKCSTQTTHYM